MPQIRHPSRPRSPPAPPPLRTGNDQPHAPRRPRSRDRGSQPDQAIRPHDGTRRHLDHRAHRFDHRSARPQRRGQDHPHAPAHRAGLPDERRGPGLRAHPRRERLGASAHRLHQGEPEVSGRLQAEARLPQRPLVLRELGRRVRGPARRRLPPAGEPPHQEAEPRPALGRRGHRRPREPRPPHLLRRAVPGPRRRRAADLLRPSARRLRRVPAHHRALHPPDRRGREPARARDRDRPGARAARRAGRRAARAGREHRRRQGRRRRLRHPPRLRRASAGGARRLGIRSRRRN